MPDVTPRRAVALAVCAAVLVYANAARNGWARDDLGLVVDNPAAHSVGDAWRARFQPYWPADDASGSAGLYRPLVTLSFGASWQISGGNPTWFHVENVLLHAAATALVVLLALAWLPPVGALAAGLVFALHPAHVEAVANVVGRADILAAVFMLAAVVGARRYRAATERRARAAWAIGGVAATGLALLSKEFAVVTITIVAADGWLARSDPRRSYPLYAALAVLTVAWFSVWAGIAGAPVEATVAAAFRGLTTSERLATAVPVLLHVVRLLAWPMDLVSSYDPQVVPRRLEWGWMATVAAGVVTAILTLGLALARRAPAVTFGVLVAAATLAPTANVFFASGLVFAERTLYLAVLAPALGVGVVAARLWDRRHRRAVLWAVGMLLVVFAARTWTRTPFWRDSRTVVTQEYLQTPENYRTHIASGRVLEQLGDVRGALREYLWAAELFGRDPFLAVYIVPTALALERPQLAVRAAHRSWQIMPANGRLAGLVVQAYRGAGYPDSALWAARLAVERNPVSHAAAETYRQVLEEQAASPWRRRLAEARVAWLEGRLALATTHLAAVRVATAGGTAAAGDWCWEVESLLPMIRALDPSFESHARSVTTATGETCAGW